jgi:glycosyltransferase involved in cell wall biosynthesis
MNVADDAIFRPPAVLPPLPRDPNGLRLIYHGNLTQRYGLDLAIRAVDRLRDEIPGIRLTLLGNGDAVDELRGLIEELAVGQYVELINEVRPTADLPDFIRAADLGIAPYRNDPFTDGLLPTKLMEYAALGMPAVAARTTAIESTFGGTMVELFAPGDADALAECLRALHRDPARLEMLRAGAIRFNERYSWSQIGAAYVALVERLGGGDKIAPSPLAAPNQGYWSEPSD